jgi:4-methyl-5(b-hydroxyethyl)-thiazole monophosphate biosynthesis
MVVKIMVPFANGFEEIEALAAVDLLRRAGMQVDMVGVVGTVIESGHGIKVVMDKRLNEVRIDDYDGIVLPGGGKGVENLGKSKIVMKAIEKLNDSNKLIAAICYAPALLAKLGVLDNRKATIYPGREKELPYPRGDRVVVDGNIITSQGPGTAIEFALAIIQYFLGPEKAAKMRRIVVA